MSRKQEPSKETELPELPELLRELDACGHHGARLLERSGLPGWSRPHLFRLMGFVAKADGRITKLDIQYAEALMRSLNAANWRRRRLIKRFQQGKLMSHPGAPWWFRLLTRYWPGTAIRIGIALGHLCHQDGPPSPARAARCQVAITRMGLPPSAGNRILASYRSKVWITRPGGVINEGSSSFSGACRIIGGNPTDSLASLRQSYRRLRGRYHPDKIRHGDLKEDEARIKLDELQQAWEVVSRRHPEA